MVLYLAFHNWYLFERINWCQPLGMHAGICRDCGISNLITSKVSKDNDNSDEEDDGIDYTLEVNWTIKHFTRHEKIVKKSGVAEYQLIAIWKGYKKDDPKRSTKEPLDSAYVHWKKWLKEYCSRNKLMAQVCKAKNIHLMTEM
jgi:hypothetical protein